MRTFFALLYAFTFLNAHQALTQYYCNWNSCDGEVQGGEWCNYNEENCQTCGKLSPFPSSWCPGSNRYCNWDDCNGEVQGGNWCNANEEQCITCGNNSTIQSKWCAFTTGQTNPALTSEKKGTTAADNTGLSSGTATTTRYWDCSGGTCGCAYQPFAGLESHCYSNAMFLAPEGNAYGAKFYGTAAVSEALGGDNRSFDEGGMEVCGKCWKVTGTSNVPGTPVETTTLVLRAANFCPPENPACANGMAHFDIAAPGFDYLGASLSNTCATREPEELEGFQSCGNWKIDPNARCDCSKFKNEVLRAGCMNFLSLDWDNPTVTYEELAECPPEMVTPCTYPYPSPGDVPDTCASPGTFPLSSPKLLAPERPGPSPPALPSTSTPLANETATTSRYWDCNGGSCGCAYQPFAGVESHCYSNAMFLAPEGNAYGAKFYGTAAVSEALGGGNWFLDEGGVEGCGKCWKVTGTSNVPGTPVETTTLILRGANFCPSENPGCANGMTHFQLAAPGFDYLGASLSNTCATREPEELEGFQSCGNWMIDPNAGCDCSKFKNEVLRAGCENFLSLDWDNPTVTYEELPECPPEMVTPCTYPYPSPGDVPDTCASPGTNHLSSPKLLAPERPGPSPPALPSTSTPLANETATTSRYWDCNGGSCGCAYQPFAGVESHCYSNAMFLAPEGNAYGAKFYGTAAVSEALGGGNWFLDEGGVEGCGKCWKVTGTSNVPGIPVETTTLILRGANFCPPENPGCANGMAHFQLAAPGFDYLGASLSNTCATREPEELEGFQSCGNWMIDPNAGCDCSKFKNEVLRAGCENFLSLDWDNPTVTYEELPECPPEMVTPCTYPYPSPGDVPDTCASPGTNHLSSPKVLAPALPAPMPKILGCCSHDFKTCENWCGDAYDKASCESCNGLYWLDTGIHAETCFTRWVSCSADYYGCCPGLRCLGNGGSVEMNGIATGQYAQCLP